MNNKVNRRNLLAGSVGTVLGLYTLKGVSGNICVQGQATPTTPAQTEGPFYPIQDQIDKDADLTAVPNQTAKPLGQLIYVVGRVVDTQCNPIENAFLDIWQACASGKYDHPNDPNTAPLDKNFQYWGQDFSRKDGNFIFKSVLPGAYPATNTWTRPPHIHVKVSKLGFHELTTQWYFGDKEFEELNKKDSILSGVPAAKRPSVIAKPEAPTDQMESFARVYRFEVVLKKV